MDVKEQFERECRQNIATMAKDALLKERAFAWFEHSLQYKYSYNFSALGRPIIQYPQDMVAMQELIWQIKPDLIIETGIAHGGSLILSASMLALLDYCEAVESGQSIDPKAMRRRVLGIDIDIRAHNRTAIEVHPLSHLIDMIQGSSIATDVVEQVHRIAQSHQRILVILDSNHTHDHVLAELEAYAPLTSAGSYCIVFDTVIEDLPDAAYPDRPWGQGNNPKTAVHEYLNRLNTGTCLAEDGAPLAFEIDHALENKLLVSVAPDGYLKRV
ncbi:cephalosporin hydroxylase [Rhodanobacter sp. ANJX3]|jgi:cephalosporin hydroxylase|uniref:cephalosporin hydroxylase family protein n=1 Tax=Rhodanobacter sp. ANJX3 TaxID=2723083 RepID=UPI001611659B|nr:cephalosporin hydroxylase family protein [Rhodanobacter sp. ANJX3]MBB5360688.1 cephalosporin hydroxylase [Rhodanobacter sp. ANJX3]